MLLSHATLVYRTIVLDMAYFFTYFVLLFFFFSTLGFFGLAFFCAPTFCPLPTAGRPVLRRCRGRIRRHPYMARIFGRSQRVRPHHCRRKPPQRLL